MRVIRVLSLVVLFLAGLTGLGLLLLHITGRVLIDEPLITALPAGVALVLAVAGFFAGVVYRRAEAERILETGVLGRLKEALEIERKQRLALSRERYKLRQEIVALEGKLGALSARKMPAAEQDELEISDEDLEMSARLEDLALTCDRLRGELRSRKERMVDLQAELSMAQEEAEVARGRVEELRSSSSVPPPASKSWSQFEGESLGEILDDMVAVEGIDVALVADDQGLLVDAAGEDIGGDALAAVTGLVANLSPRVTELLPIGEIGTVALGDVSGKVLEVRYFELFDARCALALIRDEGAGHPQLARNAIEAIYARLNS